MRCRLSLVAGLGGVVAGVVGVAEHGVGIQGDLGVEHVDAAVAGEHQRVDLHQVGVAFGVGPIELAEHVDRSGQRRGGQPGGANPVLAGGCVEPVHRVDQDAGDGIGVALGDRLDLHAPLGGEHPEVLLGGAVQREAGVVLLGDVAGLLDPEPLHHMAADVEPQDRLGGRCHGVEVRSELHAAGLAAPAGVDLRLDHDRRPQALGCGDRLGDRERRLSRAHGQPV